MLFSLDGLLVYGNGEGDESESLHSNLNVSEGRQLVSLYRLMHRLHCTEERDTEEEGTHPVVFAKFLGAQWNGPSSVHDDVVPTAGVIVNNNINRAANGMEDMFIREGADGGFSNGALTVSTSTRTLGCVQVPLDDANAVLFSCTASDTMKREV
ncbi:hypothetical protein, unlikely [Trypanosoma brucei gambiense DAL972]|uniref:Uncharacterized protein n=2 Tax=Trypanosoma brucei TaxID=5691 RepID=C9ZNY7_TRYB9|nr:hypothetical protein, unlikely [Trypanosoma brucei gambiense DAL972]XP_011773794.1 hypothetical protein, unlikely [Trypanosoma brucei gambiense DAL972]RHW72607.1 hypothetical protein DPX39_050024300 [Trypanosoma brucei equiperdum]CBH11115.1 hypothetical protein, unlikely [Trypanosoma brucei gambiense DAL972]CBH11507.1 hypothetical protein, unlikely [Trypanosoma brucei gambiense DAL972]|eukprot:XP_011773402.1 hypothetical protein, unlikely [Trypanosoma brucei gambiense DAL972]